MTRHCHRCGWEWKQNRQPGRNETCGRCESDMRVCLNCASYDERAAYKCRDRRADPVEEKDRGTFCEYFELAERVFSPRNDSSDRSASAREQLKKLLGD